MAAWDVYAVKPAIAAIESETSAAFAVNIARNRKPPSTLVRKVCTHSIKPPIKTPIAARKMLRAPNLSAIQPDIGMKHKRAHATMEATRKEEERIRVRDSYQSGPDGGVVTTTRRISCETTRSGKQRATSSR